MADYVDSKNYAIFSKNVLLTVRFHMAYVVGAILPNALDEISTRTA